MEIVEVLQQASYRTQRSDEILGFDLVFVGQNNTDFSVIFCCAGCFQKVNFQEFNLCTYINFELPSAFLYALCELLKEYAVLCGNNRNSRPEVFCKKKCSQKFRKIHRKTPVPETLFLMTLFLVFKKIRDGLTNFTFSFYIQILPFLRVE